jgi:CheY-like chemotaxis protein
MGQLQKPKVKILVVDDDLEVLKTASANLDAEGYAVFVAETAREAIRLLEAHPDVTLLFTDIVIPGSMDGFDLAALAKRRHPGLHVMYTSGYLRDEGVWEGTLLRKPWTIEDLKEAIAAIISGGASGLAGERL